MELSERIIELLSKSDPMKSNEIAEALNIDKKDLDKVLKQLKNDSKITSPKRCFYSIEK
ncbi:ArsR family transcriptional regulator [Inconstantimicrobium mannanitabidum]|uniref:MarR family transcriptional regulator n=1 Tax=Inconstantimicrobium mannanitabidum TaxID=1604901 RepID=A0ACB5RFA9_9CLOT|nr:ArsR family transcriptional regulator [Clostridium sp. TW13]GKX67591.1 MarR family transcriptional regulator [Clostridium sp. TW13]